MKFKDKDGNVFEDIVPALLEFCKNTPCDYCVVQAATPHPCFRFIDDHPAEAARLMGYEVVEDEPYKGTNMEWVDAFQRQLRRFDIKPARTENGSNTDKQKAKSEEESEEESEEQKKEMKNKKPLPWQVLKKREGNPVYIHIYGQWAGWAILRHYDEKRRRFRFTGCPNLDANTYMKKWEAHEDKAWCYGPEKEATMDKQKPRICEVLGVEVGERFKVYGNWMNWHIDEKGYIVSNNGERCVDDVFYIAVNHPDRIIRQPRTEEKEEPMWDEFLNDWKPDGQDKPLADMEWISVEERLPEVERRVLVSIARYSNYTDKNYNLCTCAVYEDGTVNVEDSCWLCEWGDYDEEADVERVPKGWYEYHEYGNTEEDGVALIGCDSYLVDRVTHWMPLPPPPGQKEERPNGAGR